MRVWIGIALVALAAPALAQTMNADQFYKRARSLEKKGPLAIFSRGEINALMREAQAAGKQSGANRKADVAAGRRPRFCPPAEGRVRMNSDEFMALLSAIPPAERARIDMTEATTRIMARKFPC